MADIVDDLRKRIAGHASRGFILMTRRDLIEVADEIDSLREALSAERARTLAAARKAGLEEAAKIAEAQPFFPDTHTGIRQQWVKDQIAASIRGLAAAFQTEEAKER